MGVKHNASYRSGENMAKENRRRALRCGDKYDRKRCEASVIRADREAFLRQQFADWNISMRFWSMARNTYIRWSRCAGKRMG